MHRPAAYRRPVFYCLRTERRFGEVSREIEKVQPKPFNHVNTIDMVTKENVLKSVGVSRQMANQYEKLAAIPELRPYEAI